jgi:hypothetical protein
VNKIFGLVISLSLSVLTPALAFGDDFEATCRQKGGTDTGAACQCKNGTFINPYAEKCAGTADGLKNSQSTSTAIKKVDCQTQRDQVGCKACQMNGASFDETGYGGNPGRNIFLGAFSGERLPCGCGSTYINPFEQVCSKGTAITDEKARIAIINSNPQVASNDSVSTFWDCKFGGNPVLLSYTSSALPKGGQFCYGTSSCTLVADKTMTMEQDLLCRPNASGQCKMANDCAADEKQVSGLEVDAVSDLYKKTTNSGQASGATK